MTHHVITISGYAQSGKDTLANAIRNQLIREKRHPHVLKFATALRECLSISLEAAGLSVDVWTEKPDEKKLIRPLLVAYGEYCRANNRDVWVNAILEDIQELLAGAEYPQFIIISDLRYSNEIIRLKEYARTVGNIEVHRVHIIREDNLPANEAERMSIQELNEKDTPCRMAEFDNGDVQAIEDFAKGLLSPLPWGIKDYTYSPSLFTEVLSFPGVKVPDVTANDPLEAELKKLREDMDALNLVLSEILKWLKR